MEDSTAAAPAAPVLERYAAALDDRDWTALTGLLAPGFRAWFAHTGERFDAAGYVAFNRDYPGAWRFRLDDLVAAGSRAVGRGVVTDGAATFHVALFATVEGGLLTELDEVWSDQEHPPDTDRSTS